MTIKKRGNPNWGPGKSGNPGGRPKEDGEVKSLARDHTSEAINRLAYWMRSDNAKASVSACVALLDRGWGKPVQAVEAGEGMADLLKSYEALRQERGLPLQ